MIFSANRLKFFSDCILTIAITIMVFDIGSSLSKSITAATEWEIYEVILLNALIYLLSFVTLAIFWVGHHNFFHFTKKVDTKLLWHNLHILFWLTMVPFSTFILGKYPVTPSIIAIYGAIMFMVSLSFAMSRRYVVKHKELIGPETIKIPPSVLRVAHVKQIKAITALVLYILSIPAAFLNIVASYACIVAPIVIYMLPDAVNKLPMMELFVKE